MISLGAADPSAVVPVAVASDGVDRVGELPPAPPLLGLTAARPWIRTAGVGADGAPVTVPRARAARGGGGLSLTVVVLVVLVLLLVSRKW